MTCDNATIVTNAEECLLITNNSPPCVLQTTLSNCTALEDKHDCSSGSVCSYDTEETKCFQSRRYKMWSDHDLYLLQLSSGQSKPSVALCAKAALGRSHMAIEKKRSRASKCIQSNCQVVKQQFCKKCKKPRFKGGHVCDPRSDQVNCYS